MTEPNDLRANGGLAPARSGPAGWLFRPFVWVAVTASGEVFGFWGMWQSRRWGRFQAFATRRQGVVVIRRRQDGPLLVTTDRPAAFVQEARRLYGLVSATG